MMGSLRPTVALRFALLLAAPSLIGACTWKRFNELKDDAPVASLERPSGLRSGFGVRLATASVGDEARLFVTGSPGETGAAGYRLGTSDQPSLEADDARHCRNDDEDVCYLGEQPAALPLGPEDIEGDLRMCLVAGMGIDTEAVGLVTRCEAEDGATDFTLPLPPGEIEDRAVELLDSEIGDPLVLATDSAEQPLLAAVWLVPPERYAWFYLPGRSEPIRIAVPDAVTDEVATSAAVLRVEEDWILAIGAPATGHVWLFRITRDGNSSVVGCLGGPDGLGRAVAGGPVVEGTMDDLVISDAANVHVIAGSALAALRPTEDVVCSMASLPSNGIVASFGCGQNKSIEGCANSEFGAALAVGDVDGDGDGEVIVGAPSMTVRGTKRAGAVLLYDVEGPNPHELTEVKFVSSGDEDDQLGRALAAPRISGRHLIAAGAPGGGKTVLFYCNDLLPGSLAGSRCD